MAAAWLLSLGLAASAAAAVVTVGAKTVQALIVQQLFTRSGRWYVLDEGACHAYLESPHTRLEGGRVFLDAHLSSRWGQDVGGSCIGVDFASNVTLSGKLRGDGSTITLEDIRVDRLDESAPGGALDLVNQLAQQSIPHALSIDLLALVRAQPTAVAGYPVRVDQFKILEIVTRPDAIVVKFDLALTSP
jgi:hypothetical protein